MHAFKPLCVPAFRDRDLGSSSLPKGPSLSTMPVRALACGLGEDRNTDSVTGKKESLREINKCSFKRVY